MWILLLFPFRFCSNLYYKIERRRILFGEDINITLETVQAVRRECKSHAAKPRRHHRKSEGGIGFQALTKKITTGWKAIDPQIKAILDQVSQEDREEHARLTKIYKAKLQKEQDEQQQQEAALATADDKKLLPTPVSPMSLEKAILHNNNDKHAADTTIVEPITFLNPREVSDNSATVSLTDDSSFSSSSLSMEEEPTETNNLVSSSMELEPLPALYSLVEDHEGHEDHAMWTKLLTGNGEDVVVHEEEHPTDDALLSSLVDDAQEQHSSTTLPPVTPSSSEQQQPPILDEFFPNHIQFHPVDCSLDDIAFWFSFWFSTAYYWYYSLRYFMVDDNIIINIFTRWNAHSICWTYELASRLYCTIVEFPSFLRYFSTGWKQVLRIIGRELFVFGSKTGFSLMDHNLIDHGFGQ